MRDKRDFYSRPEVSDAYERQRFGGASGNRVNQREIQLMLSLLPDRGSVLDLACGTGRLTRALVDQGRPVVALDYSPPMATRTAATGAGTVVGDAFQTPFPDGAFDAVVSLRFAFHCPDLEPLMREMRRLVAPGGAIAFDTYGWSLRATVALGSRQWGSRVHVHSRAEVAALAARLDLHVERAEPCFLFSPYLYRLAPLPLERAFEALEAKVPRTWLCRTFWRLSA